MNSIAFRLNQVKQRVIAALESAHRTQDKINIIAVSKTRSTDEIKEAFDAGQRRFGENQHHERHGHRRKKHPNFAIIMNGQ